MKICVFQSPVTSFSFFKLCLLATYCVYLRKGFSLNLFQRRQQSFKFIFGLLLQNFQTYSKVENMSTIQILLLVFFVIVCHIHPLSHFPFLCSLKQITVFTHILLSALTFVSLTRVQCLKFLLWM